MGIPLWQSGVVSERMVWRLCPGSPFSPQILVCAFFHCKVASRSSFSFMPFSSHGVALPAWFSVNTAWFLCTSIPHHCACLLWELPIIPRHCRCHFLFSSDLAQALNMVKVLSCSVLRHEVGWKWGFAGVLHVERRKMAVSLETEMPFAVSHYSRLHSRSGAEGKRWGISINQAFLHCL